jgi:hypothetical protein
MARAIARHEAGEAIVIPVILRACDWHGAPFGKLNATPPDGRPVTQYPDRDQALLDVAKAVRAGAERLGSRGAKTIGHSTSKSEPTSPANIRGGPRSSNLRVAKEFSERNRDAFKIESFEFMAKFFENSLTELSERNPGFEGNFRRIDANRFSAKLYKHGKAVAQCTVFMGDRFASGIAYSSSETLESNAYNELLSVDADEQGMYLRSLGMATMRGGNERAKLSQEGASELYWSMLIERLQDKVKSCSRPVNFRWAALGMQRRASRSSCPLAATNIQCWLRKPPVRPTRSFFPGNINSQALTAATTTTGKVSSSRM